MPSLLLMHRSLRLCYEEPERQNRWEGASNDYTQQAQLLARFQKRIDEVSRYLQSNEYFNPVGIDILIDTAGRQWIVDLNLRAPGPLVLGLMQGHLWKNGKAGGFRYAKLIFALDTQRANAKFLRFQPEIQNGSMVLLAWWSDDENGQGKNYSSLMLAGAQLQDIALL